VRCVELSGKSIPIHFVLDGGSTSEARNTESSSRDSYVVVPGNTPFSDLVHIVLSRIGFTSVDALAAKGQFTCLRCHKVEFVAKSGWTATAALIAYN